MAGIGEASAIISVVELGFSLASALNTYVSNVSAAPDDISSLCSEIEATLSHLRALKTLIERNVETQAWDEDGLALAKRSITDCDQIVKKLRRLVHKASWRDDEVEDDFDTRSFEKSEIDLTLFQRALWPRLKPDLEMCKGRLQMIKLDIILAHNAYMIGSVSTEAEKAKYREAIQGLSRARKWNSKKVQRVRNARKKRWTQLPSPDDELYDDRQMPSAYASQPPYVDDEVDAELQEDFERFLDEEEEKQSEAERNFVLAQETRRREEEEARRKKIEKKAIEQHIADIRISEHKLQKNRDELQARLERRGGLTPQQIESIIDDIHPRNRLNEALIMQDAEENEDQSQALVLSTVGREAPQVSGIGFEQKSRFSMSRVLRPFTSTKGRYTDRPTVPDIPSPWNDPTTRTGFANLESWYISTSGVGDLSSHRLRAPLPQSSMLKKLMNAESHSVDSVWDVLLKLSSDMISEVRSLLDDRAEERPNFEWSMMWIDVRENKTDTTQAFKIGPFRMQARMEREDGECVYIILKYEERLNGRPNSRERSRSPSTLSGSSIAEPEKSRRRKEPSIPIAPRHVSISQRPDSVIEETPFSFVRKKPNSFVKESDLTGIGVTRPVEYFIGVDRQSRQEERTSHRRSRSRSRSGSRERKSSPPPRRIIEYGRSSFVPRASRHSSDGRARSYVIKDGKPVPVKPPQPPPPPPPGFNSYYPPPPLPPLGPGFSPYPAMTSEGYVRTAQRGTSPTAYRGDSRRGRHYPPERSSSPSFSPRRRSNERRGSTQDESFDRIQERKRRQDRYYDASSSPSREREVDQRRKQELNRLEREMAERERQERDRLERRAFVREMSERERQQRESFDPLGERDRRGSRRGSYRNDERDRRNRERTFYEGANPFVPYPHLTRHYADPSPFDHAPDFGSYVGPPMPYFPDPYNNHGHSSYTPYYHPPPRPPGRYASSPPPPPPDDPYSDSPWPQPKPPPAPPPASGDPYGPYAMQPYSDPISLRHRYHPPPPPPDDMIHPFRPTPVVTGDHRSVYSPSNRRMSYSARRRSSGSYPSPPRPSGRVTELSDSRFRDNSSDSEEEMRRRIIESTWGKSKEAEIRNRNRDKRNSRTTFEDEVEEDISYFDEEDGGKEIDEIAERLSKKLIKGSEKGKRTGPKKAKAKKDDEGANRGERNGRETGTRLSDIIEEEEELGSSRAGGVADNLIVVIEEESSKGQSASDSSSGESRRS